MYTMLMEIELVKNFVQFLQDPPPPKKKQKKPLDQPLRES